MHKNKIRRTLFLLSAVSLPWAVSGCHHEPPSAAPPGYHMTPPSTYRGPAVAPPNAPPAKSP